MPNKRFSELPEVDPVSGDKLFGFQGGEPVLFDVDDLADAFVVARSVSAQQVNSTVTPASVTELAVTLDEGWWLIEGAVIWQSVATTTGIEVYFSIVSGTASLNVNYLYQSTGTTTATGVADGATTALQIMEGRAQRGSTAPGPLAGVDTANADEQMIVQGMLLASTPVTLNVLFRSEVAASQVSVEAGTGLLFTRYRVT